jgi:hypothetical protein
MDFKVYYSDCFSMNLSVLAMLGLAVFCDWDARYAGHLGPVNLAREQALAVDYSSLCADCKHYEHE